MRRVMGFFVVAVTALGCGSSKSPDWLCDRACMHNRRVEQNRQESLERQRAEAAYAEQTAAENASIDAVAIPWIKQTEKICPYGAIKDSAWCPAIFLSVDRAARLLAAESLGIKTPNAAPFPIPNDVGGNKLARDCIRRTSTMGDVNVRLAVACVRDEIPRLDRERREQEREIQLMRERGE